MQNYSTLVAPSDYYLSFSCLKFANYAKSLLINITLISFTQDSRGCRMVRYRSYDNFFWSMVGGDYNFFDRMIDRQDLWLRDRVFLARKCLSRTNHGSRSQRKKSDGKGGWGGEGGSIGGTNKLF